MSDYPLPACEHCGAEAHTLCGRCPEDPRAHVAIRELDKQIADLQSQLEAARKQLEKLKPNREDFRLTEDDLHRIVNECGSANDLSDCVKDLLLAHYMHAGVLEQLEAAKRDRDTARADWNEAFTAGVELQKHLCALTAENSAFVQIVKDKDEKNDRLNASLAEVTKQRDHARNHTEAFLSELFGRPYTYIEKDALAEQVERLAALEAERDALKQENARLKYPAVRHSDEAWRQKNAKYREAVDAAIAHIEPHKIFSKDFEVLSKLKAARLQGAE